tara:strand:- start:1719 stop:2114 length:396 start_codon:yes stop_codon:yes gene_type:complete
MNKKLAITGVILISVSIILGAFGAHPLKEILTSKQMASYDVGIRYQMYHGLGLMLLGFNANKITQSLNSVYSLLLLGTIFFSGSIYFLSLQDLLGVKLSFLGPVTPLGGILMISGWVLLILKMVKSKDENE